MYSVTIENHLGPLRKFHKTANYLHTTHRSARQAHESSMDNNKNKINKLRCQKHNRNGHTRRIHCVTGKKIYAASSTLTSKLPNACSRPTPNYLMFDAAGWFSKLSVTLQPLHTWQKQLSFPCASLMLQTKPSIHPTRRRQDTHPKLSRTWARWCLPQLGS